MRNVLLDIFWGYMTRGHWTHTSGPCVSWLVTGREIVWAFISRCCIGLLTWYVSSVKRGFVSLRHLVSFDTPMRVYVSAIFHFRKTVCFLTPTRVALITKTVGGESEDSHSRLLWLHCARQELSQSQCLQITCELLSVGTRTWSRFAANLTIVTEKSRRADRFS